METANSFCARTLSLSAVQVHSMLFIIHDLTALIAHQVQWAFVPIWASVTTNFPSGFKRFETECRLSGWWLLISIAIQRILCISILSGTSILAEEAEYEQRQQGQQQFSSGPDPPVSQCNLTVSA